MPNPNIAMSVQGLDTATPITQANQQQHQNALATEQILQEQYNTMDAREKSRLQSVISGAVQLKPYLEAEDLDGAHEFLMRRRQQLQGRIGSGENIDTTETDEAINMLRQGRVDELKQSVAGLMAAGQVYGILSNKDMPSNIQEWQYYNSLSKEDQERYLTMKRSNSVINLGGTQVVPSQVNPAGSPQATFQVTPKPEEDPNFKRDQAQAVAEGTAAGEANANAKNTISKMNGLLTSLEALKTSSANAPSGAIAGGVASAANVSGIGGQAAVNQGDFSVKRAAAENEIRQAFRVVGSGATSDRDALPFIQMLPEASDADDVKVAKTDAAMQAVRAKVTSLAQERGLPDPFSTSAAPAAGGTIRVSNGKETFEIDAADLPAAQAEGYNPL